MKYIYVSSLMQHHLSHVVSTFTFWLCLDRVNICKRMCVHSSNRFWTFHTCYVTTNQQNGKLQKLINERFSTVEKETHELMWEKHEMQNWFLEKSNKMSNFSSNNDICESRILNFKSTLFSGKSLCRSLCIFTSSYFV